MDSPGALSTTTKEREARGPYLTKSRVRDRPNFRREPVELLRALCALLASIPGCGLCASIRRRLPHVHSYTAATEADQLGRGLWTEKPGSPPFAVANLLPLGLCLAPSNRHFTYFASKVYTSNFNIQSGQNIYSSTVPMDHVFFSTFLFVLHYCALHYKIL